MLTRLEALRAAAALFSGRDEPALDKLREEAGIAAAESGADRELDHDAEQFEEKFVDKYLEDFLGKDLKNSWNRILEDLAAAARAALNHARQVEEDYWHLMRSDELGNDPVVTCYEGFRARIRHAGVGLAGEELETRGMLVISTIHFPHEAEIMGRPASHWLEPLRYGYLFTVPAVEEPGDEAGLDVLGPTLATVARLALAMGFSKVMFDRDAGESEWLSTYGMVVDR